MHLLATTFAFLMIFAMFAYTQFQNYKDHQLIDSTYSHHIEQKTIKVQSQLHKISTRLFNELHPKGEKKQRSSDTRTSLLHIRSLFKEKEKAEETEKKKAAEKLLARLLTALYKNQPFFKEAKQQDGHLEEGVIHDMIKQGELLANKNALKQEEDLATLELDDPVHRGVLYKILKGNTPQASQDSVDKEELPPLTSSENYYSLCDFIELSDTQRKTVMSVYLAPKELLEALFQSEDTANDILRKRAEVFEAVRAEKNANKAQQGEEFREYVKRRLPADINPDIIDLEISSTNPIKYD